MVLSSGDGPVLTASRATEGCDPSNGRRGAPDLQHAPALESSETQERGGGKGVFDLRVYKRDRASAPMVLCNGGLHFPALVLLPPRSRLKGTLVEHFEDWRSPIRRPGPARSTHPRSARDR